MKTSLLKLTGILGFVACCASTLFLITNACTLLKNETGNFFTVGSDFLLFILAAITTVAFYEKIIKSRIE
jgi:hypothetical protein